jgi:uncharacterized protein (DUF58 family)
MPTARALTCLLAALLLYFFANQIQVGWIYVMAALMAGLVLAAWWAGRGALQDVQAERSLSPSSPPHEGETLTVTLDFQSRRAESHIRTVERCPVAEPGSPAAALNVFIPSLASGSPVRLVYEVIADRRGLHSFPPLHMETPAPFGLFRRRRQLAVPTRLLIYPQVRPLRRLALFDRQPSAALAHPRTGFGSEVIGVRPYRSGDSPRHVHWRSTARTGQLISKEFSDDTLPGLTLAIDLCRPEGQTAAPASKHTPFEWSVKVAASLGDYALRRGYGLHLLTDETVLPAPVGPLSEIALLEYLARVQAVGTLPLHRLLAGRNTQAYIAVILPDPDPAYLDALTSLSRRGFGLLAVVLDPASFPGGGPPGDGLAAALRAGGIDTRLIRFGADWLDQFAADGRPPAYSRPALAKAA